MYEDQPFACPNKALAFSLLLAGCKLAPAEQGGPAINRYTVGFVRDRRDCAGMHIEEAAKWLYAKKVPGHVSWLFVRDAIFNRAIGAWDAEVDKMRVAKDTGEPYSAPDISPEIVMQVLCVRQNSVEAFNTLAFANRMSQIASTSTVSFSTEALKDDRGNTMPGLEKKHAKGSGKEWSIFGSDEGKKHLGVFKK